MLKILSKKPNRVNIIQELCYLLPKEHIAFMKWIDDELHEQFPWN